MDRISAVIITLNEERNIERCILSLLDVADEIIVVDSFSTDRTREICERYHAKFVSKEWLGYGAQKNYGNGLASFEYILSIDADEALSPELRESILRIKEDGGKDACKFNRLTNYCGRKWIRHCGWYPDDKVRLWKKGKARWNDAEVHEDLILDPDISISHLKGDLLHYTYQDISEHIRRADKYTSLQAEKYFAAGKRISALGMIFKSWFSFIRDYFFRLGFLDGYYGYVVCRMSAMVTFLKYFKLRELQKGSPQA